VLFSLAYNRDAAGFTKGGERYAEMREIRACVASGELAKIPGLIRSMKRLSAPSRGVYKRREYEAALFERGLAARHPEEHSKLATTGSGRRGTGAAAPARPRLFRCRRGRRRAAPRRRSWHFGMSTICRSVPSIDDKLLAALARAEPRPVSEVSANATAGDLREQGSETIAITDQAKSWAGRIFGSGSTLSVAGVLAWITGKATAVSGARDAVGGLGIPPAAIAWLLAGVVVLALLAGLGVLIWVVAHKIETKRIADYRACKNT
jgi:hypothetical protein